MHIVRSTIAIGALALFSACTMSTPGSQAPGPERANCVASAARYYKVPADSLEVVSSQIGMNAAQFEVTLRHVPSGRLGKCTVDQNGTVSGVVPLR